MRQITPDIQLAPGDTAPVIRQKLRWPNNEDGSEGPPINLKGAAGVCRFQIRGESLPWFDIDAVPVGSQDEGDEDEGDVDLDFATLVTQPSSGDYNYRFEMVLQDGRRVSIPSGMIPGTRAEFFWLHVAKDFVVVP